MVAAKTAGVDSWRTEIGSSDERCDVRDPHRQRLQCPACGGCRHAAVRKFQSDDLSRQGNIRNVANSPYCRVVQDGDESENEIEIRVT
ncbi:hypothetical protein OROMI_021777 [Orobanche minor]